MRPEETILGELRGAPAPRLHSACAPILARYESAERMTAIGGASAAEILACKKPERPRISATIPTFADRRAVLDEAGVAGAERALHLMLFKVLDAETLRLIELVR